MKQTVLVLGASSGIGGAILRRLAEEGFDLILGGRDLGELERRASDLTVRYGSQTSTVKFDALEPEAHAALVASCFAKVSGGLEGVIVCHGAMTDGAPEQTDPKATRRMLETNYLGTVSVLEACASHLEERGSGWVCAISSVAGDRGRASNYLYGSSKAAVSTYLQGLRVRMARSGVGVTDVKPGFVDTSLTWGREGLFLVASPEKVAQDAWRGIRKNRAVVYSPWFWRAILFVLRCIPDPLFKRLPL